MVEYSTGLLCFSSCFLVAQINLGETFENLKTVFEASDFFLTHRLIGKQYVYLSANLKSLGA